MRDNSIYRRISFQSIFEMPRGWQNRLVRCVEMVLFLVRLVLAHPLGGVHCTIYSRDAFGLFQQKRGNLVGLGHVLGGRLPVSAQ